MKNWCLISVFMALMAAPAIAQDCIQYQPQEMTILDSIVMDANVSYDIEIRGHVGYVGTSNGIFTLDLTDLANLTVIGHYPQFGCISIALIDGLICVGSQDDGVIFVDATDPANLTHVASFPEYTFAQDAIAQGNYFYVGNHHLGVLTFDATDRANPQLVSSVDTDETVTHLLAHGDYLYTVGFGSPLMVWDISDPAEPSVLHVSANYYLQRGYDLMISGSHLYMPNYTYSMQVISIQNPANPVRVTQVSTHGPSYALAQIGNHLFAGGAPSLLAMDITVPQAPQQVGRLISSHDFYDIEVYGEHLLAVGGDSGVFSLDVSQPVSTLPLAVQYAQGNPQDIVFHEEYGFVSNGYDGLYIRTMDSASPLSITEFPGFLHSLTIDYPLAYLALDDAGVQILSIADPEAPQLFDNVNTSGHARDVAIYENDSGKYALVADTEYDFARYDVTDPWDIRPKGVTFFVGNVYDVEVYGDYALIADNTGLLHVMDVSLFPDQPELVTSLEVQGSVTSLWIEGTVLYASGGFSLSSVDITDPTHPTVLDTHQLGRVTTDFAIFNGLAYCTQVGFGMEIVDVSDGHAMVSVARMQTVEDPTGIGIGGETVFLTADYETLILLPLQCRASPVEDVPGQVAGEYLHRAFPNPFNPLTTLSYHLPARLSVHLKVYDLKGRLVDTLVDGEVQTAGRYLVPWNGTDSRGRQVGAGVYLYSLQAAGIAETRRMVLIK